MCANELGRKSASPLLSPWVWSLKKLAGRAGGLRVQSYNYSPELHVLVSESRLFFIQSLGNIITTSK